MPEFTAGGRDIVSGHYVKNNYVILLTACESYLPDAFD